MTPPLEANPDLESAILKLDPLLVRKAIMEYPDCDLNVKRSGTEVDNALFFCIIAYQRAINGQPLNSLDTQLKREKILEVVQVLLEMGAPLIIQRDADAEPWYLTAARNPISVLANITSDLSFSQPFLQMLLKQQPDLLAQYYTLYPYDVIKIFNTGHKSIQRTLNLSSIISTIDWEQELTQFLKFHTYGILNKSNSLLLSLCSQPEYVFQVKEAIPLILQSAGRLQDRLNVEVTIPFYQLSIECNNKRMLQLLVQQHHPVMGNELNGLLEMALDIGLDTYNSTIHKNTIQTIQLLINAGASLQYNKKLALDPIGRRVSQGEILAFYRMLAKNGFQFDTPIAFNNDKTIFMEIQGASTIHADYGTFASEHEQRTLLDGRQPISTQVLKPRM